jgi:CATRA-associated small protein
MAGIDDAAHDELRSTLQIVPRWKLNEEGWSLVEARLHGLRRALENDDRSAFFRQLEGLDRLSPPRLGRLDADDVSSRSAGGAAPPPPPVVELVNTLVHPPVGDDGGLRA